MLANYLPINNGKARKGETITGSRFLTTKMTVDTGAEVTKATILLQTAVEVVTTVNAKTINLP